MENANPNQTFKQRKNPATSPPTLPKYDISHLI